jgi:hypothetical protein
MVDVNVAVISLNLMNHMEGLLALNWCTLQMGLVTANDSDKLLLQSVVTVYRQKNAVNLRPKVLAKNAYLNTE